MFHVVTLRIDSNKLSNKKWKTLTKQNPNMDEGAKVYQCVILTSDNTLEKCVNGDFTWAKSGWTKNAISLIKKYCKSFDSKIKAYECRENFVKIIRNNGGGVFFDNPRNCKIYIIELGSEAWSFKNFKQENKSVEVNCTKLVYIGETSKKVVDRFKEHKMSKKNGKKGDLASEIVFKHGIGFEHDLMKPFENKIYTKLEALKKEREIGLELRKRGYATWFN